MAVWNGKAPTKVCNIIDVLRVIAPKVIPVKKRAITSGTDNFFFLKKVYAVIKLKTPRIGMCGGAE